jgi:hypothetical protein
MPEFRTPEDREVYDRAIKAMDEFSAKLLKMSHEMIDIAEKILRDLEPAIRLEAFADALCNTPVTCKCRAILFANYESQERRATQDDVRQTSTDLAGGWARGR